MAHTVKQGIVSETLPIVKETNTSRKLHVSDIHDLSSA